MEKRDIILDAIECRTPERIPSLCLGANYDFMEQYFSEIGMSYDIYSQYRKDGIPIVYALLIEMGFDFSWAFVSSKMIWLENINEPALMHGGRFKIITRDSPYQPPKGKEKHQIPHYWYTTHGLNTKQDVEDHLKRELAFSTQSMHHLKGLIHTCETKYGLILSVGFPGPWENLHLGAGMGNIAKWWRKDRNTLHKLSNLISSYSIKGMKDIMKIIKPLFVLIGDDYGFNDGLQMSLEMWRELVKPTLRELAQIVHDAGSKFLLHSCGNIGELFPEFVEIGVDGVQSLKPINNDLIKIKKKYGSKISLLGTIDDTDLLKNETPNIIKKVVKKAINDLGPGGFIPGPTNFLLDQPPKNIIATIQAINDYKI